MIGPVLVLFGVLFVLLGLLDLVHVLEVGNGLLLLILGVVIVVVGYAVKGRRTRL